MAEIKRNIDPKWPALGLFLISRIPGRVAMRDGSTLTVGEIAATVIVHGAKEIGDPALTFMDSAIAVLERFSIDDPNLQNAAQEVQYLGGELRQVLGYGVLRGGG